MWLHIAIMNVNYSNLFGVEFAQAVIGFHLKQEDPFSRGGKIFRRQPVNMALLKQVFTKVLNSFAGPAQILVGGCIAYPEIW